MFRRFDIDFTGSDTDSPDTFDALQTSINFEDIVRGRKGAILVDAGKNGPSSLGLPPPSPVYYPLLYASPEIQTDPLRSDGSDYTEIQIRHAVQQRDDRYGGLC